MAIVARKQTKQESISEADAKKMGLSIPKPLKLAFKKPDLEVNLLPAEKPADKPKNEKPKEKPIEKQI